MGHAQPIARLDFEAYLDWEITQSEKHEFIAGEIFAMGGARRAHVTVALNIASALKSHLRGGPCRAYVSDMKLRVIEADASFYPDVMVSCDPRDHAAEQYLQFPTLIVEILSDGTAAFDRGDKFAAYRKVKSLREYVIVDIDARRIECFRLDATGHWVLHEFSGDVHCELESVRCSIPITAVFEDAEPPAGSNVSA
jgi:Uma2 family endonuclease